MQQCNFTMSFEIYALLLFPHQDRSSIAVTDQTFRIIHIVVRLMEQRREVKNDDGVYYLTGIFAREYRVSWTARSVAIINQVARECSELASDKLSQNAQAWCRGNKW